MVMSLTEWCDHHGFDYFDEDRRAAWQHYVEAEMCKPQPIPIAKLSGRITRTWVDDRADELRRRSYRRLWRVIWTSQPLRIVRNFGPNLHPMAI